MNINLGIGRHCGIDHSEVQVTQIMNMHMIPFRLPWSDDRSFSALECRSSHHVYLTTFRVPYSSTLAIDGRRADDGRLDSGILAGSQHDLVDIAMKGVIGQVGQCIDSLEIVVGLIRQRLAIAARVSVLVRQDARTAGMNPVGRVVFAMSCCETCSEGLGGSYVV